MGQILLTSIIISLFTCGLNILFDYRDGEPKRFQMLLFRIRKYIYENRNKIESKRDYAIKNAQDYYRNAINSLRGTQDVIDVKIDNYNILQDRKIKEINELAEKSLWYEWYLKPIFLCVYCMPSFWGTIIWLMLWGFNYPKYWIISVVISVFINGLFWNIYKFYDNN